MCIPQSEFNFKFKLETQINCSYNLVNHTAVQNNIYFSFTKTKSGDTINAHIMISEKRVKK